MLIGNDAWCDACGRPESEWPNKVDAHSNLVFHGVREEDAWPKEAWENIDPAYDSGFYRVPATWCGDCYTEMVSALKAVVARGMERRVAETPRIVLARRREAEIREEWRSEHRQKRGRAMGTKKLTNDE